MPGFLSEIEMLRGIACRHIDQGSIDDLLGLPTEMGAQTPVAG
jgi:hypothetical protein